MINYNLQCPTHSQLFHIKKITGETCRFFYFLVCASTKEGGMHLFKLITEEYCMSIRRRISTTGPGEEIMSRIRCKIAINLHLEINCSLKFIKIILSQVDDSEGGGEWSERRWLFIMDSFVMVVWECVVGVTRVCSTCYYSIRCIRHPFNWN